MLKILCSTLIPLLGCNPAEDTSRIQTLRFATTTTTYDSGLIEKLLPPFEQEKNVRVDVIAVGTGKALKLAEMGEVDVVMVHSRKAEEEFMAAGKGTRREDVIQNYFLLVGPADDPAKIENLSVPVALQKIAQAKSRFISRGDESGTNHREIELWQKGGGLLEWENYIETGQGMGATLTIANQMNGYTLTDEGTFYRYQGQVDLIPFSKPTQELINSYGIIVVNPQKNPQLQAALANDFVDYILASQTQRLISEYKINSQALFHPSHQKPSEQR